MVISFLLLATLAGVLGHPAPRPARSAVSAGPVAADSARTLLWAIDGLSYDAFVVARQRGLFRRFEHAGRHVAPYPSMSHPSWTEITGARRVFGERANIRTVEARWFDLEAMRVASDPRQVFARQAGPFNYMRAFDWFFDPLVEPLLYFRGDSLANRELAEAERDILERFTGRQHVVFIGGVDAIAHTQRGVLHGYLQRLDAMMTRVIDSLDRRGGAPVHHVIVSDHGNAGRFAEGAAESYLTPVSLAPAFRAARLVRRDTGALTRANEAAVATIALASMVNVYVADLSRRRAFAAAAVQDSAVDLVTWLEVASTDRFVVVHSRTRGELHVRWQRSADGVLEYAVRVAREGMAGRNPLELPDSLLSRDGRAVWISDRAARDVSMSGRYPDALNRLVRSATKEVENAPDLIVNLRDGYCFDGDFGRYVRMVRTHGALDARATLGLVAATHTAIPAAVRSDEILAVVGLAADSLFRRSLALAPHDAHALADSLVRAAELGPARVATGRDDESPDAAFLRRVKPLVASQGYFDASTLQALVGATRADAATRMSRERRLSGTRDVLARSDISGGVTGHVDALWGLGSARPSGSAALDRGALRTLRDRTETQLRAIPELAPLTTLRDLWAPGAAGSSRARGAGVTARQSLMAAWTLPYFVNAALDAPELDSLDDPRDRPFAQQWHARDRARVRTQPGELLADTTLASRLFAQVLAERRLLRDVETPATPRLYDAPLPDVAVLYVPGIFGELFDDEIWQRGLHALREQLGVRVIPAGTDGRCSAADNATRVLQAMREDTDRRLARGYAMPRYVIVGYSKGGVDAAHALVRDTALARAQVAALVTIASPHGGTPVAERTDLSDGLLDLVVARPRPAACDTTRAVESLWPATRAAFWSGPGRALDGLVPLLSLSLASDLRDAHPWMKITKRIARFTESNDGVVSRSASRMPASVASLDLGALSGDHIAARAASDFPQESVLEAVLLTLGELGLLDPSGAVRWHDAAQARAARYLAAATPVAARASAERMQRQDGRLTRDAVVLPGHIEWRPDRTYKMSNLESLADRAIPDLSPSAFPHGVSLQCDQDDMTAFRREYEFLYDAGNGGSENDLSNGFAIVESDSTDSGRACRLRTHHSAMKMTTASLRLRPDAFAALDMRIRVTQGVVGAAPDKGGRGRNDATLKLWLVLRDERAEAKGRRVLLGYNWAARDADGRAPHADSLVEASASRRRIGFSTLPESWLFHVGGPEAEGRWVTISRDLVADLRRAYPAVPSDAWRVVAMTVQSDSDETRGDTELLIDRITFRPRSMASTIR